MLIQAGFKQPWEGEKAGVEVSTSSPGKKNTTKKNQQKTHQLICQHSYDPYSAERGTTSVF